MLKNFARNFLAAWKVPRWRAALLIAAVSDAVGLGMTLLLPLQLVVDVLTAGALLGVLGFRWAILPALAVEVVPVLQLFPAWTLFVLALAGTERQPPLSGKSGPEENTRAFPEQNKG